MASRMWPPRTRKGGPGGPPFRSTVTLKASRAASWDQPPQSPPLGQPPPPVAGVHENVNDPAARMMLNVWVVSGVVTLSVEPVALVPETATVASTVPSIA